MPILFRRDNVEYQEHKFTKESDFEKIVIERRLAHRTVKTRVLSHGEP